MEPLKIYDYLSRARERMFEWVRPRSAEEYARVFPFGRGTLGTTLTHILISEWYYIERMSQRPVPAYAQWPIRDEEPPAFAALEAAWGQQRARTRAALGAVRDWGRVIEYRIDGENGLEEITASVSDIFTQLVLHEVHHRAQVMAILRQMGVEAQDIDYNTMVYGRRRV